MHELALTEGILKVVSSEQKKGAFTRVLEIDLGIGEFSGVIPSCIEEFFPLAAKDTAAEGAKLVMETIPASFTCSGCGYRGAIDRHAARCPDCGSTAIRMTAGREFFIKNLVVN
jgi:hydrogenase nickel incorporation protein HypA/HybF